MSVKLTDEMKEAMDAALDDGCPVVCSSVENDGYPTMSFYGSAHVHDHETVGIWVRNPEAGFLKRIKLHEKDVLFTSRLWAALHDPAYVSQPVMQGPCMTVRPVKLTLSMTGSYTDSVYISTSPCA